MSTERLTQRLGWVLRFAALVLVIAASVGLAQVTEQVKLFQNYPNPFSQATEIVYSIPHTGTVTLKVYNMLGKELEELVNGRKERGEYRVRFEGSNYPTGQYSYTLSFSPDEGGGVVKLTKRMFLVR